MVEIFGGPEGERSRIELFIGTLWHMGFDCQELGSLLHLNVQIKKCQMLENRELNLSHPKKTESLVFATRKKRGVLTFLRTSPLRLH